MHKYWTLFGNRKDYHLSIGTRRWQNNCGIEQFYAVEQFIFSCYHKSYNDKRTFWSPGEVATVQPQSTVLLIPSTCPDYMDALLTKLGGRGQTSKTAKRLNFHSQLSQLLQTCADKAIFPSDYGGKYQKQHKGSTITTVTNMCRQRSGWSSLNGS